MLITVPRSIMLDPTSTGDLTQMLTFGLDAPGLAGLGQDPTDSTDLPTDNALYTPGLLDTSVGSNPDILASALPTGVTATSSSSGSTIAQDISALGPALAAAAKGITAASGPYAIPNTNYVYNPATGQILMNGAAVGTYNAQTGAITALSASGLMSYLPLIMIAVVGLVLVSSLGGKR
jgi:hypothetical protein